MGGQKRGRRNGPAAGLAILALLLLPAAGAPAEPDPAAASLAALVAGGELPELHWPRAAAERDDLSALYAPRGYAPLWLETGRPTRAAADATQALLDAGAWGLVPSDYAARSLAGTRHALATGAAATPDAQARFDLSLSVALLRLLSHLHAGRVSPKRLSFGFEAHGEPPDLAAALEAAVREDRLPALIEAAQPRFTQQRLLVAQLARYRALAADASVGPVRVTGTLRPGQPCPGAEGLARWLAALGDLPEAPPAAAAGPTPIYDGELVAAVQRFQVRHGLAPDGVIGPRTAAALAVPAEARVRQIELALERLRWIPELPPGRAIFVNIPAFELFAFEALGGRGEPALAMRVVVGKRATRTPVFTGMLATIVFAPYWNVPRSIVVNEYLPGLLRDPASLAPDMEIVGGGVAELAAGRARLRQRPGPRNALGRVKFLFPNAHDVYLHDTPSRGLFARERRDFSHGCIRVERPAALAEWLLRDRPDWPPERMRAAMAAASETHVRVTPPVPVVIFYTTAVAQPDPDGPGPAPGTIHFYDDLYEYDAALERALAGGYPYPS